MIELPSDEKKTRARERALRAARVVTIAAALVGGFGCSNSHGRDHGIADASGDTRAPEDVSRPDIVADATDTRDVVAEVAGDVGCPEPMWMGCFSCEPQLTRACCEAHGLWWEASLDCCTTVCVGPLVPPAMIG